MTDPKVLQDKMMSAMTGPGDAGKLSKVEVAKRKKEAAKLKQTAKIIPLKKPAPKAAVKKPTKKTAAPVKKAAANKKVVRKTMKAKSKKSKR
jgi:hypothetical protein